VLTVVVITVTVALAVLLLVSTEYGTQIFPAAVGRSGHPAAGRGNLRGRAALSPQAMTA
jgi:hypothetical protein